MSDTWIQVTWPWILGLIFNVIFPWKLLDFVRPQFSHLRNGKYIFVNSIKKISEKVPSIVDLFNFATFI